MKSPALWTLLAAPAVGLLTACTAAPKFGLPWIEQGPGISPDEARTRLEGRRSTPPPQAAARAEPEAAPRLAEPPPPASGWGMPPVAGDSGVARAAAAAPAAAPRPATTAVAAVGEPTRMGTGYPQASRYGDLVFLSGQIPLDFRTREVATEASAEEQARITLENVRSVLEAQGLTTANLVSTTVYLKNINDLGAVDAAYARFFKGVPPSRTVVEVSRLPRGVLLEISAIAGR